MRYTKDVSCAPPKDSGWGPIKAEVTFDGTGLSNEELFEIAMHSSSPTVRLQREWKLLEKADFLALDDSKQTIHLSQFLANVDKSRAGKLQVQALVHDCETRAEKIAKLEELGLI